MSGKIMLPNGKEHDPQKERIAKAVYDVMQVIGTMEAFEAIYVLNNAINIVTSYALDTINSMDHQEEVSNG